MADTTERTFTAVTEVRTYDGRLIGQITHEKDGTYVIHTHTGKPVGRGWDNLDAAIAAVNEWEA